MGKNKDRLASIEDRLLKRDKKLGYILDEPPKGFFNSPPTSYKVTYAGDWVTNEVPSASQAASTSSGTKIDTKGQDVEEVATVKDKQK
jgi:hypothetical protein